VAALRIAVADDEPQVREYFKRILPRMGHELVAAASSGRELVDQCRALRPELVITDINMPEMTGVEAANTIWHDLSIPFIFVSARHDPEALGLKVEGHVVAYLVKPIKRADLELAIRSVITQEWSAGSEQASSSTSRSERTG
jgi:CheY-like chemotaxis protein